MDDFTNYYWPGNVRELENILERAVIISSGPKLRMVDDFNRPLASLSNTQKVLEAKTLEQVEYDYIVRVLEQTDWKVSGENSAARILGLNRSTLRARMRKLNIIKP
jgi:chemotaxis protein methyltransferase CheR